MTIMRTPDLNAVHHPVVARELTKQAEVLQLRIADLITRFAGSMLFVYIHVVAFAVWMLVLEQKPWPTLTLVVSLEAIFLSTFVMIARIARPRSSNRRLITTSSPKRRSYTSTHSSHGRSSGSRARSMERCW